MKHIICYVHCQGKKLSPRDQNREFISIVEKKTIGNHEAMKAFVQALQETDHEDILNGLSATGNFWL